MKLKIIIPILLSATIAQAQTYNFDIGASNTGWIEDTGNGNNNNSNYIAGSVGNNEYRNYFSFDLSNVLGSITEASITINPFSAMAICIGVGSPTIAKSILGKCFNNKLRLFKSIFVKASQKGI